LVLIFGLYSFSSGASINRDEILEYREKRQTTAALTATLNQAITLVKQLIPILEQNVVGAVNNAVTGITSALPLTQVNTLVSTLTDDVSSLVSSILGLLGILGLRRKRAITDALQAAVASLTSALTTFSGQTISLSLTTVNGVVSDLKSKLTELTNLVANPSQINLSAVKQQISDVLELATNAISAINGLTGSANQLVSNVIAATKPVTTAVSGVGNQASSLVNSATGTALTEVQGVIAQLPAILNGVVSVVPTVLSKVQTLTNSLVSQTTAVVNSLDTFIVNTVQNVACN